MVIDENTLVKKPIEHNVTKKKKKIVLLKFSYII